MPQLILRQSSEIDPHTRELLENLGRKVKEDFDRFRPAFQKMIEMQSRIMEVYSPVLETIHRFAEVVRPTVELVAKMQAFTQLSRPNFDMEAISLIPVRTSRTYYPTEITEESPELKPTVNLPQETKWNDLTCRFKDGHTVSVLHKGKLIGHFDYESLGFSRKNTRDLKPDKQWQLLSQLSIIYENSKLYKPTVDNLTQPLKTNKQAVHKIKQTLSKKLRAAFGIADDPFHSYDSNLGYRLKFIIQPERNLRGDGEVHPSGSKLFDDQEYLKY